MFRSKPEVVEGYSYSEVFKQIYRQKNRHAFTGMLSVHLDILQAIHLSALFASTDEEKNVHTYLVNIYTNSPPPLFTKRDVTSACSLLSLSLSPSPGHLIPRSLEPVDRIALER